MNLPIKRFRLGITIKLFLLNLIVALVLGGILTTVFLVFHDIDNLMLTIFEKTIPRVIENARSGQEVTGLFANLVTSIFYGQGEALTINVESLEQNFSLLTAQDTNPELQTSLRQFMQQLTILAELSRNIETIPEEMASITNEFIFNLELVEDIINEKLDELEGEATPLAHHLKQLQAMSTGYREAFFQIVIQVNEFQREDHQREATADEVQQEDPAITALDSLLLRFQTLTTSDPDIAEQGKDIMGIVQQYKEKVIQYQQTRRTFQEQLRTVNEAKAHALYMLQAQDEENARAAGTIRANLQASVHTSRNIITLLSAGILIVLLLTNYSALRMVRPLIYLSQAARRIAMGDVNFHLNQVRSRDEIGTLSAEFRNMMVYMQEMATVATQISQGDLSQKVPPRTGQDTLGNAFQSMSMYLQEIAAIATAMANGELRQEIHPKTEEDILGKAFQQLKSLRDTIREIMGGAEQLGNASTGLRQISTDLASGAEQSSQQAQVVSLNSQQISQSMTHVSSATEELAANIRAISHSVQEVSQIITSAVEVVNSANTTISTLEARSREIGDIINIITTITQQTNLLALNATIEAARAGEVGKGFAVVAHEVKALAREIAVSAEDIIRKIEAIQVSTIEATQAIIHVSEITHQVHELSTAIATMVEQQAATTNEISRNIADVADGSDEITHAIAEVATTSRETSEQAAYVQDAAQKLTELAGQLSHLVGRFKI